MRGINSSDIMEILGRRIPEPRIHSPLKEGDATKQAPKRSSPRVSSELEDDRIEKEGARQ